MKKILFFALFAVNFIPAISIKYSDHTDLHNYRDSEDLQRNVHILDESAGKQPQIPDNKQEQPGETINNESKSEPFQTVYREITSGLQVASSEKSLARVVDLDIGEDARVVLHDGSIVQVKVVSTREMHESVTQTLIGTVVQVVINGKHADLVCGSYHLPVLVGGVQVDVPVVGGYMADSHVDWWKLKKAVRLRFWPAGLPWIEPGTFMYPLKQRWLNSDTWYSNEPVSRRTTGKVYYHAPTDFGGAEGLTEVVAATDGVILTLGTKSNLSKPHPAVDPKYDMIYMEDSRGWIYQYAHLKAFDPALQPGSKVIKGQSLGYLGKEGTSGGWAHLHFGVRCLQPSGEWGVQDGYAFLWQAYREEYDPEILAVARPRQKVLAGEKVVLDASRSWAKNGVRNFEWIFTDGTTAFGPTAQRIYDRPGIYSEIVKVTDSVGNFDYDFANVWVYDKPIQGGIAFTQWLAVDCYPTFGIKPGDPVIFHSRGFRLKEGVGDIYDFGDGTPRVSVPSNIDGAEHAANGYGTTTHNFQKPGHYIVRIERLGVDTGWVAVQHLHIVVEP